MRLFLWVTGGRSGTARRCIAWVCRGSGTRRERTNDGVGPQRRCTAPGVVQTLYSSPESPPGGGS